MRVLVVHPQMTFYGGAELVIVKLLNYMAKKGIPNALLTLSISPEIKKEIKGSEIILPKKSLWTRPKVPYTLAIFPTVLTFGKYLKQHLKKFDVVNVHNFPAELAAIFCDKKVVWMCNEPPQLHFAGPSVVEKLSGGVIVKFDKFVVKNHINRVCVADEFNAKRFEKIYHIKPTIVPYGVDCDFFANGGAQRARKKFKINNGDFVLLQVGVLTPFKNQLKSVKVAAALKKEIPNVKLVLAGKGDGEYEQTVRKQVQKLGLEKNVVFTGHVPRTVVRDLYAACDVAIFPVKPQGGWLSPFEALCANKPIVVSTKMTASGLIKKNKIGVVTEDFAKAILSIRGGPAEYQRIAKRGHRWVKENLSWDRFCERMVACFRNG